MNNYRFIYSISLAILSLFSTAGFSQLTVTPGQPAAILAAKLAGPGITILSPTLTCPTVANGTFVSVATPLTIDSGILLTTGKAVLASGAESYLASTNNSAPGDPALATLALTATLFDACTLQFDFVPKGDTVSFNYQFGSEEYNHSTCGPYNDAFAFFISGPGIVGTQNMALIPGTTIPVTVNSVNSGIPGPGYTLANCTAMGAGSPFTAYYYDNTGGTQLTYKGYTNKMTAFHSVAPCDTYHLKISICDAGNALYDSGVFIEAGSLKTNSFAFDHTSVVGTTVNGVPNTIVKGCSPATIKVISAHATTSAQTVHFIFGGTAIHGTDFTAPDSATIATGADSVVFTISGLSTTTTGSKTVSVYLLSSFSCGIADSITLNIMDTPSAHILTPDTTICSGVSFPLRTTGTPGLAYSWSPATGLSSAAIAEPTASPTATATYIMNAALTGSGCPTITSAVTVVVDNAVITLLTADTSLCGSASVSMLVTGDPALSYSWSPAAGLSNPFIQDPIATPDTTTDYTVTATSIDGRCSSSASVLITVANPGVSVAFKDTTICLNSSMQLLVHGPTWLSYNWSPSTGLSNPYTRQPIASPTTTTTYTITATVAGSSCITTGEVTVHVASASIKNITANHTIPYGSSIQLNADSVLYYMWTPDNGSLNNTNINDPVATPLAPTTYVVHGLDKYGCPASDSVKIDLTYDNIFIPDAFTPNNDGRNDFFRIANLGYYKLVNMSVYNRWGALVYHVTDGDNKGWDGTYYGAPQDMGTYNYLVIIESPEGITQTFKGNVTLIR